MDSSTTQVSLLTARGMSAIASIALAGAGAKEILSKVFRATTSQLPADLTVVHGSIVDGHRVIDEVVVAAEGPGLLVIHCHGNPLLAEEIIKLLQARGAILVDADTFALERFKRQSQSMIEAEVRLAIQKTSTLAGAKILTSQINAGLFKWVRDGLVKIDTLDLDEVKSQCRQILQRSIIATRIIDGVKIVLAGAPNSGKSTLLNCLAGDQQVIVSDTAGTTRDWVSVTCRIGLIYVEFIDTAGLDDMLAAADDIEQTAQQITRELLDSCDLMLHVQDVTQGGRRQAEGRSDFNQPVIEVFNKCDLIHEHNSGQTQELRAVYISAKENIGIDSLTEAILQALQVNDYSHAEPIAFTSRQREMLAELLDCDEKTGWKKKLEQLLG